MPTPRNPETATARSRRRAIAKIRWRRVRREKGTIKSIHSQPDKLILSEAETAEMLRLHLMHDTDEGVYDALSRLVSRGRLKSLIYSGVGGGRRMFSRHAVAAMIELLEAEQG